MAVPVPAGPVLVTGTAATGAPVVTVRGEVLRSVETGSLALPALGRNIRATIAMATVAAPADEYNSVRFLRAGSYESAWIGAAIGRASARGATLPTVAPLAAWLGGAPSATSATGRTTADSDAP